MTKIPCGGFKLDENFFGMNENDELSLAGGAKAKTMRRSIVSVVKSSGDGPRFV